MNGRSEQLRFYVARTIEKSRNMRITGGKINLIEISDIFFLSLVVLIYILSGFFLQLIIIVKMSSQRIDLIHD